MQITNNRSYLCGGASRKGPLIHGLKLKRAMASLDGKRIVQALSEMLGVGDVCKRIPYLEDEELFGLAKKKLDLPIG